MALRGTLTHWKTQMLAETLAIPETYALGILEALWHVTAEDAPQGNIGRLSNEAIMRQMRLAGHVSANKVINALIASHHLDKHPEHRLLVHDWHIHADYNTKRKLTRNHLDFLTTNGAVHPMASRDASSLTNGGIPEPVPEPEPEPEIKAKTTSLSTGVDKRESNFNLQPYLDTWNSECGPLAKVVSFNTTRQRRLRARIAEGLTLAHFKSAVTKAARTPKCIGDNADKWQVSFDWLVADENNIAKLLEGAYDSRTSQPVRRVSNVESYRAPRHA
jgi:hypothetical protein